MPTVLTCGGSAISPYPDGRKFNQTYQGAVVFLLPGAGGLTTLNFDVPLPGSAIAQSVVINTALQNGTVVYIADDLSTSGVLETQGTSTVVGSISSYQGSLRGTITFPSAVADNTNIFIKWDATEAGPGEVQRVLAAIAYDEDPCIPRRFTPSIITPVQLYARVCSVDICAGDAAGIYLNGLLAATATQDGAIVPVGSQAAQYTWELSGTTQPYIASSLIVEGVDVITTNTASAASLAAFVAELNANAQTSGLGIWTTTGTTISVVSASRIGNIAGTANAVPFDVAPTVSNVDGRKVIKGYWTVSPVSAAVCDCQNQYQVWAYSEGAPIVPSDVVEWRNGTELISLTSQSQNCLYTYTLPAVGTGYTVSSLLVNGVNYLTTVTGSAASTSALAVLLNALDVPLGTWSAPSATTIALRTNQVLGAISGTANGTAFGPTLPARSGCILA